MKIQDIFASKRFFLLRLEFTCERTCKSVWRVRLTRALKFLEGLKVKMSNQLMPMHVSYFPTSRASGLK